MYSRKVIDRVIESHARKHGWEPVYHSIGQIEEFSEYLSTLTEEEHVGTSVYVNWKNGPPSQQAIRTLKRWQENERFLIMADAEYFISRYCKIRLVDERLVRMQLRIGQQIFLKVLAEFDDRQIAIQVFILKSRQVGISTAVAMFFLQRILTRSNTHAVMASATIPQSDKLNNMIKTALEQIPIWLKPSKTVTKEKEPRWENGSVLSIQAGSQTVAIAEGSSPSCIHISEIASFDNPTKIIEQGLFPAAHQTASLFFVMEGTGDIATPWQKEKWEYYKANWGKESGARFRAIYIPPSCAPDIYPPKDWLRANPIPEGWYGRRIRETKEMEARATLFIRSTDYLADYFGPDYEVPIEFQWFWECGFREAKASNTVKTFLSQIAVTDTDAFQSKFDPVFSDETINVVTKERVTGYKAYAITGKTIIVGNDNRPYQPPEHEIDYHAERIPLRWEANDGNVYEWTLIPLKPFDDSSDEECFDKLLIFEDPMPGEYYSQGVDTAGGLGLPKEERACTTIHRNRYGKNRSVQVASFTSIRVNSAQMSRIAAAMAVYYTTDGDSEITSSNPLGMRFCVEQTRKAGDECVLQLQLMGFYDHHHFHFYDDKNTVTDQDRGTKLGWRTTQVSRPILLDQFVNYVTGGWLKINDPITIRQMKTFIRKKKENDSKSVMTHDNGQFDDNIFANAMASKTAHDIEDEAQRYESKYQAAPVVKEALEEWCTGAVCIDD